jgi:hypothetical protein
MQQRPPRDANVVKAIIRSAPTFAISHEYDVKPRILDFSTSTIMPPGLRKLPIAAKNFRCRLQRSS